MGYNLARFIQANKEMYPQAYAEVLSGEKKTHWASSIIPQYTGISSSERSKYYAIKDMGEAKAYWKNKLLRTNYLELMEALLKQDKTSIEVLGLSCSYKLHASLSLFLLAALHLHDQTGEEESIYTEGINILKNVLDRFYEGDLERQTILLLGDERYGSGAVSFYATTGKN